MERSFHPVLLRLVRSKSWALTCMFIGVTISAIAQVTFEASVSPPEVIAGNQFEVTFTLKNADGRGFRPPDFNGFRILGGPSQLQNASSVNGKTSYSISWTFLLEARQPGNYTIGPASVTAGGKQVVSRPVNVRVAQAKTGGARTNVRPPDKKGDLFITGEVDQSTAFVGQQVTYQVKVYTLVTLEGADLIGLPDFNGVYAKEKRRFDTRVQYVMLGNRRYAVKVLHEEALFPQASGTLTIGAARVRALVETGRSGFPLLSAQPLVLETEPVSITVKPLPEPAPGNFSGVVGNYEWEIAKDRDSLTTDDALTIQMIVRGNGDARRFLPPVFEVPAGLEKFDPKVAEEEEFENGEQWVHTKKLEYVILPKEPGDYTVTPTFCWFDPDSNRYRTLQPPQPYVVKISKGTGYESQQPLLDSLLVSEKYTGKNGSGFAVGLKLSWKTLLGLGLLVFVLLFFWWYRRHAQPKPASVTPPPANTVKASLPQRHDLLAEARRKVEVSGPLRFNGDPVAFYDALYRAMQGYLLVKLDLPKAQLNSGSLRRRLLERNVSAVRIQTLMSFWQTCEQVLFAGQPVPEAQLEVSWQQAQELVKGLDQELGPS